MSRQPTAQGDTALPAASDHLRIRNLDTGEEILLNDDDSVEAAQVNAVDGSSKARKPSKWLHGTKKLTRITSWAKDTIAELQEKRHKERETVAQQLPPPAASVTAGRPGALQAVVSSRSVRSEDGTGPPSSRQQQGAARLGSPARLGQSQSQRASGQPHLGPLGAHTSAPQQPDHLAPSSSYDPASSRRESPHTSDSHSYWNAAASTTAASTVANTVHNTATATNNSDGVSRSNDSFGKYAEDKDGPPGADGDLKAPARQALPVDRLNPKLGSKIKVLNVGRSQAVRHLGTVKLIQEVRVHDGVVWCVRLSRDGQLLATGGQDGVLRVWSLQPMNTKGLSMITESFDHGTHVDVRSARFISAGNAEAHAAASSAAAAAAAASHPVGHPPLLGSTPLRELQGHLEDILALAWSHGKFLLSASVDKTARLWHLDEPECLRTFEHPDFVTCVEFHPVNQRRFVTGCLDGVVRVWDITDSKVVSSATVHMDMVTALTFSQDGKTVVVGTMRGKCRFYNCSKEGVLDYCAQIDVKDRTGGALRSGRKVTCIRLVPTSGASELPQYVISSNDSRLRLFSGYGQERKYKGAKNKNTQVQICLSPSGSHVVSGSDDGCVVVWEMCPAAGSDGIVPPKNSAYEAFQTGESTVTAVIFAPQACWRPHHHPAPLGKSVSSVVGPPITAGAGALSGALMIVAGFSGRLQVYLNT